MKTVRSTKLPPWLRFARIELPPRATLEVGDRTVLVHNHRSAWSTPTTPRIYLIGTPAIILRDAIRVYGGGCSRFYEIQFPDGVTEFVAARKLRQGGEVRHGAHGSAAPLSAP